MDWPTMDQELAAARYEIKELKERLEEKNVANRDLEMDLNFHVMKARELQDVLDATGTDQYQKLLQAKGLQNAGLAAQVQTLRLELGESSSRQAVLESKLTNAKNTVRKVEEERRTHKRRLVELSNVVSKMGNIDSDHGRLDEELSEDQAFEQIKSKICAVENDRQRCIEENYQLQTTLFEKNIEIDSFAKQAKRFEAIAADNNRLKREMEGLHNRMLVELSEIIRFLNHIDVDYGNIDEDALGLASPDRAIEHIKLKILVLERHRQKCMKENRELQTELFDKGIEINSCEQQVRAFEAVSADRDRLQRERIDFQLALETKDTLIKSLEQSLASKFGQNPCQDVPSDVCEQKCIAVYPEEVEVELCDEHSVIVCCSSSVSRVSIDALSGEPHGDKDHLNDETGSLLSQESHNCKMNPSEEEWRAVNQGLQDEVESLRSELKDANLQTEQFKANHQKLKNEIRNLKKDLEETRREVTTTKTKQELREKLLREVIVQYKDLQKEYDETTARLSELQEMVQFEDNPDDPANPTIPSGRKHEQLKKGYRSKESSGVALEESSTFETAESSSVGSNQVHSATSSARTSMSGFQLEIRGRSVCKEDYERLEKEATRLEHEYEDAVARVANLELDLKIAREDLECSQSSDAKKQAVINDMQCKHDGLKAAYDEALSRVSQLTDELMLTEISATEALESMAQREKALADAIARCKELESENKATLTKMSDTKTQLDRTKSRLTEVEHELSLLKRHAKRKDLVFSHLRMEKQLKTYQSEVESLQRELKLFKAEAARNKEETKVTKRRLMGCHYQFQKIKEQYEEIAARNSRVEKKCAKAERRLQHFEAQHEALRSKMTHIQELRRNATAQNQKLLQENTELINAYCNDILHLVASESVGAAA